MNVLPPELYYTIADMFQTRNSAHKFANISVLCKQAVSSRLAHFRNLYSDPEDEEKVALSLCKSCIVRNKWAYAVKNAKCAECSEEKHMCKYLVETIQGAKHIKKHCGCVYPSHQPSTYNCRTSCILENAEDWKLNDCKICEGVRQYATYKGICSSCLRTSPHHVTAGKCSICGKIASKDGNVLLAPLSKRKYAHLQCMKDTSNFGPVFLRIFYHSHKFWDERKPASAL